MYPFLKKDYKYTSVWNTNILRGVFIQGYWMTMKKMINVYNNTEHFMQV